LVHYRPQWASCKIKGEVLPITGQGGPEAEMAYSTVPSTLALDGCVCAQCHAPAALPPRKTRYPSYRRLGGSQGQSGRVRKISPPTTTTTTPQTLDPLDRPARSESPYRLSYPGPLLQSIKLYFRKNYAHLLVGHMPLLCTFWKNHYQAFCSRSSPSTLLDGFQLHLIHCIFYCKCY
jgi:hypothetical protein